jgi:hypothetical protein
METIMTKKEPCLLECTECYLTVKDADFYDGDDCPRCLEIKQRWQDETGDSRHIPIGELVKAEEEKHLSTTGPQNQ